MTEKKKANFDDEKDGLEFEDDSLNSDTDNAVRDDNVPRGGYHGIVFLSPTEDYRCPICLMVLKDPHILECCGSHICKNCIEYIKAAGNPCPCCREKKYMSLLDKRMRGKILGLRVKCIKDGCHWEGELGDYERKHSPNNCPCAKIEDQETKGHDEQDNSSSDTGEDTCYHVLQAYKDKKRGGTVKYKAVRLKMVGPPQVGKTTTKDRLLGVLTNLKNSPNYKNASTGFEKPAEISLDDISYLDRRATTIGESACNWKPNDVKELAQHLLKYIEQKTRLSDSGSDSTEPTCTSIKRQRSQSNFELEEDSITTACTKPKVVSFEETDKFVQSIYGKGWKENLIAHLEHSTTAYIIDSGGQPEFQDILPLLLRGPAFYLIFFSLAESLDDIYTITYTNQVGKTIKAYKSAYSVKYILSQLMSTFAHAVSEDKCLVTPTAFLFATHKDKVTREKIKSIDSELRRQFKKSCGILEDASKAGTYGCRYDSLFVPVDNQKGKAPDVRKMQKFLTRYTEKCCMPIEIPTTWLFFHLILRSKYECKKVCTLKECTELATNCGIAADHVVEVLEYIHGKLGTILYFKEVPGLNDCVICDPEILFKSISKLIENVFDENESVYQNGEISESTLAAAAAIQCESSSLDPELVKIPVQAIIDLLKHHCIITDMSKEESSDGKECNYFMPCLLRPDPEVKLEPSQVFFEKNPLVIYFSSKIRIIPVGLVTALAVELRSFKLWKFVQKQRYKNHYIFQVHKHSVAELIVRGTHLELHCKLGDRAKVSRGTLCYRLYQDIKAALNNVTRDLKYPKPVFGLYCWQGDKYHLVRCNIEDEQLRCEDDPTSCPNKENPIMYASQEQMDWFQKPEEDIVEAKRMKRKQKELNQLLKHYGVKRDELSVRCEDIHLIAQHIEDWEALAPYLGLKERRHRIEIARDHPTHAHKTVAMLELWAKLNGYEATYFCLIEACLKARDKELCGEICKIFMETRLEKLGKLKASIKNVLQNTLSTLLKQLQCTLEEFAIHLQQRDLMTDTTAHSSTLSFEDVVKSIGGILCPLETFPEVQAYCNSFVDAVHQLEDEGSCSGFTTTLREEWNVAAVKLGYCNFLSDGETTRINKKSKTIRYRRKVTNNTEHDGKDADDACTCASAGVSKETNGQAQAHNHMIVCITCVVLLMLFFPIFIWSLF